ncbi:MAG: tetratricopeptide repeat protein [bacterium]
MNWDDVYWRLKNEPEWLVLIFLCIAAIAGGSYYYYQNTAAGTEASEHFNRVFIQYIQSSQPEDYEPVIQQFERLSRRHAESKMYDKILYFLGKSYFKSGQYNEAVQQFLTIIRRYPESFFYESASLHVGYSFYQLGRYESALDHLSQLDTVDSKNPIWSEAKWQKALVYKMLGDDEKARDTLTEIIETTSDTDNYWTRRARELLSELIA